MGSKMIIDKVTNELNEIKSHINYFKTSHSIQSGLAYVHLSSLIDELLLYFGGSSSAEYQRDYHQVVGDILYDALKILGRLNVFCRRNAQPISNVESLYSFAKNEAASYVGLYALICTNENKYTILKYIQKKSYQECLSLKNYYADQPNLHCNARNRDAIYQTMRLNLASKIYVLSVFGFIKNMQAELVKDMARYLPFTKKFGYREKYFPYQKLFLHTAPINASVIGIVDSKNSSIVFFNSDVSLTLCEISTVILQKLEGQNVVVTGIYDGDQSMAVNGFAKTGAYGWLAEFFSISSGLEPSRFLLGNPKIELI